jgi:hypothetical protein
MAPPVFNFDPDLIAIQIAGFTAAPVDGFAANLNVQVHQKTNIETFTRVTTASMKANGIEILSTKELQVGAHPAREWVYRLTVQGKALRFIALAAEDRDHVVLLTATCLESRISEFEPQMRAALSSFKFDK